MNYKNLKNQIKDTRLERDAFLLAKFFLERYKKTNIKTFKLSNVKNTKWWTYFTKCVKENFLKKEWDAKKFIDFQFNEYGEILPFHLSRKKAWDAYSDYYRRGTIDKEKAVALGLLNSFRKIKKFGTFKDFFNDKKNILFVMRGEISPYFLSISKSFLEVYANLTENEKKSIISIEKLKIARAMVFSYKKILNKIKKVLNEEFI